VNKESGILKLEDARFVFRGLACISLDVFFNEVRLHLPFLMLWLTGLPRTRFGDAGQSSAKPAFFLPPQP
jgi:hypothetical protein